MPDKKLPIPPTYNKSVYSDIFEAIRMGDVEQVEIMNKQGANLHSSDNKHKFTGLHWAAYAGSLECLHYLLWKGCDPNGVTPSGYTPLHIAAVRGTESCVQALIDSGSSLHACDHRDSTPTHLASIHGNSFTLNALLRGGADVNARDKLGWTPAHAATFHGRLGCLQTLAKWGAVLDEADSVGNSPAHLAASEGQLLCLKYLVSKSHSSYDVLSARNDNGETPKMLAQQFFKEEMVNYIENIENDRDHPEQRENLSFPAHVAAYNGDLDALQLVVDNGIVNINERDDKGATPAHKAAGQGHQQVLQWLIEMGADMTVLNSAGETPSDTAARFARLNCVKLLGGHQAPAAGARGAPREPAPAQPVAADVDDQMDQAEADETVFAEKVAAGIIKLSREERHKARGRAMKRLQEMHRRLEISKKNFAQLGGVLPELKEKADHDQELVRLTDELKENLEYERLKREKLEAQLDEYRRENARLIYELDMMSRVGSSAAPSLASEDSDWRTLRSSKTSTGKSRSKADRKPPRASATSSVKRR